MVRSAMTCRLLAGRRRRVSVLLPIAVVWSAWLPYMAQQEAWHLFTDVSVDSPAATATQTIQNTTTNVTELVPTVDPVDASEFPLFALSITMVFGSFVAGATSEGGAAVAFPVMTLVLGIRPIIARDFGLMIQSVGMVAASFTIIILKVTISHRAVFFVSLGGVLGSALAIEVLFDRISPPYLKLWFCCLWMSFAVSLWFLNRHASRPTFDGLPGENGSDGTSSGSMGLKTPAILFFAGIIGGCLSGLTGSGIDMASFSVLTLLFRVSEKVATPSSVVIMGISSVFGFFFRGVVSSKGISSSAWSYWLVCVPIVVVGAPLGAFVGRKLHRLTLAQAVYAADALQLAGALFVIRPWFGREDGGQVDTPVALCVSSVSIFVVCGLLFRHMSKKGLERISGIRKGEGGEEDIRENSLVIAEDVEFIVL